MTGCLHDRLGYEVHRTPLKVPPCDVIIWNELAYVRQRQYEAEWVTFLEADRAWIASPNRDTVPRPAQPDFIVRPVVEKEDPDNPASSFVPTGTKRTLVNTKQGIVSGKYITSD